jgi:hypothetical protein
VVHLPTGVLAKNCLEQQLVQDLNVGWRSQYMEARTMVIVMLQYCLAFGTKTRIEYDLVCGLATGAVMVQGAKKNTAAKHTRWYSAAEPCTLRCLAAGVVKCCHHSKFPAAPAVCCKLCVNAQQQEISWRDDSVVM